MFSLKQSKIAKEMIESGKYPDTIILDVRKRVLKRGLRLKGSNYHFIIHETVIVELAINRYDISIDDDTYILFSTDENKSYYQELIVKDNIMPFGDKIKLEFIDPLPDLNYSLKVDLGADDEIFAYIKKLGLNNLDSLLAPGKKPEIPLDSHQIRDDFYKVLTKELGIDEETRKERNVTMNSFRHLLAKNWIEKGQKKELVLCNI
jgi:hypothetical protein